MLQDRKIHCLHLSVVCIVHASFSPDILQAGAVKGLKKEEKRKKQDNTKQCVHCWHRCLCQGEEVRMVSESLDFTILRHANCTGSLQDKNNNSYCKWQQKWLMEFVLLDFFKKTLWPFSLFLCHNCLSRTEMKVSMLKICTLLCCPFFETPH